MTETANMLSKTVYVGVANHRRLTELARVGRRPIVDQLTLILDEACDVRGLDRETLQPLKPEVSGE